MIVSLLMILTAGCASVPGKTDALRKFCDRLDPLSGVHADALSRDGGPESRRTGARLIAGVDGGCGAVR